MWKEKKKKKNLCTIASLSSLNILIASRNYSETHLKIINRLRERERESAFFKKTIEAIPSILDVNLPHKN